MHSTAVIFSFASVGLKFDHFSSEHITIDYYNKRKFQLLLYIISSFFIKKITVLSSKILKKFPYLIRRKMVPIDNPLSFIDLDIVYRSNISRSNTILFVGRLEDQRSLYSFASI